MKVGARNAVPQLAVTRRSFVKAQPHRTLPVVLPPNWLLSSWRALSCSDCAPKLRCHCANTPRFVRASCVNV